MDPVETRDKHVLEVKNQVVEVLAALDPAVSIHDFRMVDGKEQINLIFDMVVPFEYDHQKQEELKDSLKRLLKMHDSRYEFVMTVERSYVASAKN